MKLIPYKDLSDSPEDTRIREIGETVMATHKTVGVVTDDETGKAERYITKLKAGFPGIHIYGISPGPVAGTRLIRVGPPIQ